MGKNPVGTDPRSSSDPVEPEKVTAPVTALTPWEIAGMTEEIWKGLEIPPFLRRTDTTPPASSSASVGSVRAPTPAAASPAGEPSGPTPKIGTGATGGFDHFRVDPEEIERKIKAEADVLWRNWMPTKTDRKRPTIRKYLRQVRKLYYP